MIPIPALDTTNPEQGSVMPARDHITPTTQILDANGYDWAWAYVVFRPFHSGYCLGSDGSVWSALNNRGAVVLGRWRRLSGGVNKGGYNHINFCLGCRTKSTLVHRAIAVTFLGDPGSRLEVCHNNGNSLDNSVYNLRWDTRRANHSDKRTHGTMYRGSTHYKSHLSEADVSEIRHRARRGEPQKDLARRFGVAGNTIAHIVHGRTWRHVTV